MTEQLDTLRVAFDDGVSAGAEKARKSLEGLGNEAIVTEERVTRTSRSGAALGRQFGDTERLTAKLEATSKRFQRALDDLEKSELDLADKEKLRANILAQQAAAVDKVHASHQRYLEAMRAAATASNDNATGLNATAKAATGAADGTKLAAHQVANLTYQLQDAAVQLAGGQNPLLILMQQGPQATGAVGGVANAVKLLATPMTAVAAAAAAFVIPLAAGVNRALELSSQTRTLSVAIQAVGASARVTTADLSAMIDTLRRQGVAQDEAISIAKASLNPRLMAGVGGQLAELVPGFMAGTGLGALEAMNRLTAAMRGGSEAIAALALDYNVLDAEQLKTIRDMARAGDGAEALRMTIGALQVRFGDLHEKALSPSAKAMEALSNAWRGFTTAIAQSAPIVVVLDGVARALTTIADAIKGDWSALGSIITSMAPLLGPLGVPLGLALEAGPGITRGNQPPVPRARPGSAADVQPIATQEQIDAKNRYIEALQREEAVLRASLPDRAAVRAAQEAQQYIDEKGLVGAEAAAVMAAKLRATRMAEADAIRQQAAELARSTTAALAQAEAWQQGGGAAEHAAAMAQAIEINETKARINVEAYTAAILNNNAARAASDLARQNDEMAAHNAYLAVAIEAEKRGAEAVAEVEIAERKRLATREAMARLAAATDQDTRKELEYQIKATNQQIDIDARLTADRKAAAMERQQQLQMEVELAQRSIAAETDPAKRLAMEQVVASKQAELQIRAQLAGATDTEIAKNLQLADAIIKTQAETKRLNEIREKARQIEDDVTRYAADSFATIFSQGAKGWAGLMETFRTTARVTFARIAAEALIRPIVQPITLALVGGLPSLFGISGATGTAGASSGGLGSILSPITDILGMAKSFVGDTFSGVSSWINGIGSSLGFASTYAAPMATSAALGVAGIPGGVSGTMMGTATNVGGLFGSTTLSGFLGGAGLGFGAGNLLASLLGRSGTGSTVGSGIGSLAGAAIGSIFPGVGTILGGLLGGAGGGLLGSFFGGDEQRPLGNAQLGAVKNGRLTFGSTTSLDGYDNSREIQQMQQAVTLVNGIIDKFGLTLDESLLRRGFEDTSNPIGLIGKTSTFDGPANLQEWIQRFFSGREGQSYLKGATGTLGVAFDRLSSGGYKPETGDDVLKMLDYAAGFDDAVKRAAAGVNTLKRQTLEWEIAARDAGKGLAKTVKDYIDQARQYFGEGSTQVNQAATAQRQSIYSMMNLDTSGNAIDPNAASDMLTGRAADLAQAKAQIAQFKDALIATGLTAEQAAAAVDRGMAATAAAINARWDEIDRRSNAALNQRQGNAAIIAYGARSGYTSDQLAIDAQAEQQRQELYDAKAAGKSPAEIARIETAQATERAALAEQQLEQARRATESMTDRQNAALVTLGRASEADAQRSSMQARHRQELWDAEHQGRDKDSIKMLLHTQQLEDEALAYQQAVQAAQQAAQAAGAFNASLTSVAVARAQATATAAANQLTDANTALATAEQDLNAARSAAAASINEQVSAWNNAANSLKSIREQLLTGNLNPADRYQQMMAAQGLYQDARAKASSDPTAAAALGGYAQQYLQTAMAYLGPNAEYARIFDEVTGTLQGTETVAQQQARTAQSQLAQLQNIAGSTKSVDEAFAAYVAAQAAKDKASAGKATAEAGMNSGLLGQFDTLAGQYSAYMATETPKFGAEKASANAEAAFGGARDAILNAITDWKILNQIGERYYNRVVGGVADVIRVKVLQLGGTPSFEQGGYHWGGLRLVGERGPELEATGPARYWSAADTRAMLAPGAGRFDMPAMPRGAANDRETTAELVAELKALRKEVAELKGEAQAGNRIAIAAAEANVDGLAVTAREQRQTATAVKRAGVAR